MADDRQTLMGKWKVHVKSWVWEYEFFPDGSVTWRDTGSSEKGSGQWAMSSSLVNFWWFNSATRESWQRPLSPASNKRTWYASSYFTGAYQIQKITQQPEPPKQRPREPIGDFDVADVIVRYQGVGENPRTLNEFDIFPDTMLRDYWAKTPKRKLVRLGRATTTIRDDSAALIAQDVAKIEEIFKSWIRGGIFIYGSSSGGRNALDLAVALENKKMPLVYIAVIDAAFFPNEARNKPDSTKKKGGVPLFGAKGAIATGIRENFFQLVGNHVEGTSHLLLFTSKMANHEVHGDIGGFTRRDLTDTIDKLNPPDDEAAHRMMITDTTPIVRSRIKSLLDKV